MTIEIKFRIYLSIERPLILVAMTILAWFVLATQLFVHLLHSFHYSADNSGVNQWGVFPFIHILLLKYHAVLVEEHRLHSLAMCFIISYPVPSQCQHIRLYLYNN